MYKFIEYKYSARQIENRVGEITLNKPEGEVRKNILRTLLSCIDLTTLEGNDTQDKAREISEKAFSFNVSDNDIPNVAAVCVFPSLIKTVKQKLSGTGIKAASVAGAFPHGQTSLEIKLNEVAYAIEQGADEIDMVISRGKMLEGNFEEVFNEIAAIKTTCQSVHLKVILETAELPSVQLVRKASEIAINAGADFIKTSTGKVPVGATPEAFLIMLDTIREYYEATGKTIGIKPAGGIRASEDALVYYHLLYEVLGVKWINNDLFRIGASSLADNLVKDILEL